MLYLKLFLSFIKIGFFGFGGGYPMLSLIQNEVVRKNEWLTNAEFTDIVAISQVTPGPIAINTATYVGYTITGSFWGSLLATVAVCLPALTIMVLVTKFYLKLSNNRYVSGALAGMKPVMVGMILAAALLLLTPDSFIDYKSWIFFGACFILALKKVDPILIIVLAGFAGWLVYGVFAL